MSRWRASTLRPARSLSISCYVEATCVRRSALEVATIDAGMARLARFAGPDGGFGRLPWKQDVHHGIRGFPHPCRKPRGSAMGRMIWRLRPGDAGFNPACDFNGDGPVDVSDLLILAGNWGT